MVDDAAAVQRAEQFARISAELLANQAEQPTLERIVHLAVETIPACDSCGIFLKQGEKSVVTAASTDPLVDKAHALQQQLGQGPCLETIWQLDTCLIDDLRAETRWPEWVSRAADLGIGSALSLRLQTAGATLGSLNLYATDPRAFDHTDVAIASIFARHAAAALDAVKEVSGLRTALRSRQLIGVAQGMLMQRYRLSLDQSFEVLRRYSQDENIKLRDLAEQLVHEGQLPTSSGPGTDQIRP